MSKFSFIIILTGIILNSMSSTTRIFGMQPQPFSSSKYFGISSSGSYNSLLLLIYDSNLFYEISPILRFFIFYSYLFIFISSSFSSSLLHYFLLSNWLSGEFTKLFNFFVLLFCSILKSQLSLSI